MLKTLTLVVALAASIAARQDSKLTDITGTWVIEVESVTGIPREKLRPDLYAAPRPRKRPRMQPHV